MLLGAAFSPVSQPIADTSKYWNLIQVSKRLMLTLYDDLLDFPFLSTCRFCSHQHLDQQKCETRKLF